ncbi:MAG: hypothetical protein WD000_10195 [Thermodesulfobacteriota bacterium]
MATPKGVSPNRYGQANYHIGAVSITETLSELPLATYANGSARTEAENIRETINTDNTQANLLNIPIHHTALLFTVKSIIYYKTNNDT